MNATSTRILWASAEREACALLTSSRNVSKLLELAGRLGDSPDAGQRGYSQFWLGFFEEEEAALNSASSTWQTLAFDKRSDAQDRAWWMHCAVVAELCRRRHPRGPAPDLLARTYRALGEISGDLVLASDRIARQTFSLIQAEICILLGEDNRSRQIIMELETGVPFKKSLAVEMEGAALAGAGNRELAATEAFDEASTLHLLFIHKARCIGLKRHLESGTT